MSTRLGNSSGMFAPGYPSVISNMVRCRDFLNPDAAGISPRHGRLGMSRPHPGTQNGTALDTNSRGANRVTLFTSSSVDCKSEHQDAAWPDLPNGGIHDIARGCCLRSHF